MATRTRLRTFDNTAKIAQLQAGIKMAEANIARALASGRVGPMTERFIASNQAYIADTTVELDALRLARPAKMNTRR